jgi:hypothetical protein
MNPKVVVFVIASLLLVFAVYSSLGNFVFATHIVYCDPGKTVKNCWLYDTVKDKITFYKCTKNSSGKWVCVQESITPPTTTHDTLDLGLQMSESIDNLTNANANTTQHPSNFVTIVNQTTGNSTMNQTK